MKHAIVLLFIIFVWYGRVHTQETKTSSSLYKLDKGRITQSLDHGTTWAQLENSPHNVLAIASPPSRAGELVVATKNTLYYVYTKSGSWHITLQRGHEFTPTQIKFSTQRTWETWIVSEAEDDDGNTHTELWFSRNGGVSWNLARYVDEPANTIHLDPDDTRKFWVEQSQQGDEGK